MRSLIPKTYLPKSRTSPAQRTTLRESHCWTSNTCGIHPRTGPPFSSSLSSCTLRHRRPVAHCTTDALTNYGYKFVSNQSRLPLSSLGAVCSDKITPLNDCAEDQMSPFDSSDSTSENGEQTKNNKLDVNDDIVALDVDYNITPLCDTLIGIFLVDKPNPTDWRKLLAFSRHWKKTRPHFFKRCQDRAESEDDPGMKHKLLRLGRKLKEVDEDVQRHNELLELIKGAPSEIGAIVARRRKDFTKDFFNHFYTVAGSYYENPTEQDVLTRLGDMCVAAVQNYDKASENTEEALNTAELKFKDILDSSSVDAACRKIDNLAQKDQLDLALVLMISKAWSTAKESSMVKDEAKDVMYHLYMTARSNLQKLMPKEVRILKYLLMIEDRDEQLCALNDAVSHGVELEGKDGDLLYTTPEKLHSLMNTVLDAYHFSMEGTLIKGARDLLRDASTGQIYVAGLLYWYPREIAFLDEYCVRRISFQHGR